MDLVSYDPLTSDHPVPMHKPGCILRYKDGILLAYYKVSATQATTQGHVAYHTSAVGDEVSTDTATALASDAGCGVAGVAMAAITAGNYGYFQVSGIGQVALLTAGSVTAGAPLTADSAATDGRVIIGTVGTHHVMGVAFAADAGTVLAANAYRLFGII